MVLQERITLMANLGQYFLENKAEWQECMEHAHRQNAWFTLNYIQLSVQNIAHQFLQEEQLREWASPYPSFEKETVSAPLVGLVMAGNIPLVGFHDFLAVFISGCKLKIKLSSKDSILWEFILKLLYQWNPEFKNLVSVSERLNNCDAYIATGSNNTARYFEYYFQKYPHIIRSNRTSIAILTGSETKEDLEKLSDDICSYYGFGCRNVSKIFVPEGYHFEPLIAALNKYAGHIDHNKYKNNYDFQLALYLLNKVPYMSSDSVLLIPSESAFAPISVLHYETYQRNAALMQQLSDTNELQCVVSSHEDFEKMAGFTNFGKTQIPNLDNYADGVNTLNFLDDLRKLQKTSV